MTHFQSQIGTALADSDAYRRKHYIFWRNPEKSNADEFGASATKSR